LNGIGGGSRKGEKMCKMTQEMGSQKRKEQMHTWTGYEPWCAQIEDWMLIGRADKVMGICLEEKTQTALTSGFSTMLLCVMR
jgi:hypothetical protein